MFTCMFMCDFTSPFKGMFTSITECYLGLLVNLDMLGNVNKCVYIQVNKYVYMYFSLCIHALFTCL